MGTSQTPPASKALVPDGGGLLLFDGRCGLCDRTVQFVLARDRNDAFRFATLQGELARAVLEPHGIDPADLDTFHLVVDVGAPTERVLSRGDGAVEVLRRVGGAWGGVGRLLAVLPGFVVDLGYRMVAAVRYPIFGRVEQCNVPDPEQRRKILD
jgi:predicted DCC family thiol-disulfide oxidoreductase YuxK